MLWWLRNEQTRALVQPLPRPVGLPARLRSRAICWSGIRRANARISDNVSSGTVQRCLPTPFIFSCSGVWSPPCQCRVISMNPPSMRTMISCNAVRRILLRGRRGRVRPSELQIGTELHQVPPLFLPERCWPFRLELSNLALEPMHDLQRLIPAALERASHKTIVGINSIILPPGICRREPGLLQRQLELPSCGGYLALLSRQRLDRGIDAERLQYPQHFRDNGIIGAQAAE